MGVSVQTGTCATCGSPIAFLPDPAAFTRLNIGGAGGPSPTYELALGTDGELAYTWLHTMDAYGNPVELVPDGLAEPTEPVRGELPPRNAVRLRRRCEGHEPVADPVFTNVGTP